MKWIFAAVYMLVLVTQIPHVWTAYAAIERPDLTLARYTAIAAAIAFESSLGIFTFRIVNGSRRRWTRRGLWFFIAASIVANAYYYQLAPFVFGWVWPVFATVALPLSLALFAEEFGAEVKQDERKAKREERQADPIPEQPEPLPEPFKPFTCTICGAQFDSQAALSGHGNAHRSKNGRKEPEHERQVNR